jgi:hypothetical protein
MPIGVAITTLADTLEDVGQVAKAARSMPASAASQLARSRSGDLRHAATNLSGILLQDLGGVG